MHLVEFDIKYDITNCLLETIGKNPKESKLLCNELNPRILVD